MDSQLNNDSMPTAHPALEQHRDHLITGCGFRRALFIHDLSISSIEGRELLCSELTKDDLYVVKMYISEEFPIYAMLFGISIETCISMIEYIEKALIDETM